MAELFCIWLYSLISRYGCGGFGGADSDRQILRD